MSVTGPTPVVASSPVASATAHPRRDSPMLPGGKAPQSAAPASDGTSAPIRLVVQPQPGSPPLPGASILLRLISIGSGASFPVTPGAAFAATVVAAQPGSPVVLATPFGWAMADEWGDGADVVLSLRMTAPGSATLAPATAQGVDWSLLRRIIGQVGPGPQSERHSRLPAVGPELAARLAGWIDALGGEDLGAAERLLGDADVEPAGELPDDVRALRSLAQQEPWRAFVIPLVDGSVLRRMAIFLEADEDSAQTPDCAHRFVLELEPTQLGSLQFDGVFRGGVLRLVIRSERPLPDAVGAGLRQLFRDAVDACGLSGHVHLEHGRPFNAAPRRALAAAATLTV